VGVPSDVGEVLAAMTHGSATVPDPLHPLHRHDIGACELPLPREPVAFAMRISSGGPRWLTRLVDVLGRRVVGYELHRDPRRAE
jgi:hypothetical protein